MIDRKEKIKFLSRMCRVKECEKCKLFPSKCVEFESADDQEIDDMFRTAFPVMSSNEEKEIPKQQDYKDLIKAAVDQIRKIQDDLIERIFAES